MEKDSIKELMRKVGQKIDLFEDRVSFISGQEASSCQFPCIVMIMDKSVSNAHEVELIMSRATLYLYVIINRNLDMDQERPNNLNTLNTLNLEHLEHLEHQRIKLIFDFFAKEDETGRQKLKVKQWLRQT